MSKRFTSYRPLILFLLVLLIVGMVAALVARRRYWQPLVTESAFMQAYEDDDREAVVDIYRLALQEKQDAPADSERRQQAKIVAEAIESTIASEAKERYQVILDGAILSDEDRSFFSAYDTLSTTVLLDSFIEYAYDYLCGLHSNEKMRHMLEQSIQIDVIDQTYGRVMDEYADMVEARPKIMEAESLMEKAAWYDATRRWQTLESDRSLSHFTKGYVEQRIEDAKAKLLEETIKNVSHLLEQNKFYSARELLNVILPIFPYDIDLLNFNREAEEQLPKSFISWDLPVDHIAVRPLIAAPERAFASGRYAEAADRWLLLSTEFHAMLKQLYDNDYVLVADDAFITDQGLFKTFRLPEGKKPLVLVFDSFHLSTMRYLSGTPERLVLQDQRIVSVETDPAGKTKTYTDGDAISILEAFLQDYPDFSFNGAKATIAVTGQYGLFGYVLNPAQAILKNEQRTTNGLPPLIYDEAILEAERQEAKAIADHLLSKGYTFASNSYADISLPDVSLDIIAEDDQLFKSIIVPFIGDVRSFSYPAGRHVNTIAAKTGLLTECGYSRLLAHGTIAYFAYGDGYTHIDMNLIGGQALRNPLVTGINRFFDTGLIVDREDRPY